MKSRYLCIVFLYISVCNLHAFEKIYYVFPHDPIDVVIPCHIKDVATLDRAITSVKKYVQGVRRVIVISSEQFTNAAEWADEALFPFTKESLALEIFKSPEIASYQVNKPKSRMGWIYQQFLKLFAAFYIPDISSNVLMVDSDVIFFRPVNFLGENGAGLYNVAVEYHAPYFEHAATTLPGIKRVYPEHSGIVHHMLFQKPVLTDFFSLIQKEHGVEPWVAIARAIPLVNNDVTISCMSEYEMYFNFVFARTDQVKIRKLNWINKELKWERVTSFDIDNLKAQGYDYVAIHTWDD